MTSKFCVFSLIVTAFFLGSCNTKSVHVVEIPTAQSLVEYLASDSLEGRFPGTKGDSLAEAFIVSHFKKAGLTAVTPKWRQPFVASDSIATANVIGFLKGSDPLLAHEIVVVGAHFDHLGWGGPNSSSRCPDTLAVHPGADDNASGVATLIQIAYKMAAEKPKRSILFTCFGAEEIGLVGSKHFVSSMDSLNLLDDTTRVRYRMMINLDMVGHLAQRPIVVEGAGTALGLDSLLKEIAQTAQVRIVTSKSGYGASDHTSFYLKKIPVSFIHTAPTEQYHTPLDKPNTLDYLGMDSVSFFTIQLIQKVANDSLPLVFQQAEEAHEGLTRNSKKFKVKLGLMPDVAGVSDEGMFADIVVKGKPAYNAGMRSGDLILSMNGVRIHNVQEYMKLLMTFSPDDIVIVAVKRGEKHIQFQVKL